MDAFYFGEKDKPLLGFYHPASGYSQNDSAIVICNPIGHEGIKAHAAIKMLADRLAANGHHVLRFDYYATGDSSGESSEGSVPRWNSDICLACDELKEISGCNGVTLIGIRFGAMLSILASAKANISALVLVDPVLNGEAYIDSLAIMQKAVLRDPKRFYITQNSITSTQGEFVGHTFPESLQAEIRELSLDTASLLVGSRVEILPGSQTDMGEVSRLVNAGGANLYTHEAMDEIDWTDTGAIEEKLIFNHTIDAIVDLLD